MTKEEISDIADKSLHGRLTDWQCRCLVHYMIGYLRHATSIDLARDDFFRQVTLATEGREVPAFHL